MFGTAGFHASVSSSVNSNTDTNPPNTVLKLNTECDAVGFSLTIVKTRDNKYIFIDFIIQSFLPLGLRCVDHIHALPPLNTVSC